MTNKYCKHYDGCNAPLCPMEIEQESNCTWFPDEDICKLNKKPPKWVSQQKKIASKVQPENEAYYFTVEMLSLPFRVTKNVKGLDPDLNEVAQLRAWKKENIKGKRGSA